MDSFEHDGMWWDPDTPDRQLVGTLRFDAATGASSLSRCRPTT
jgi:hypothetical protein